MSSIAKKIIDRLTSYRDTLRKEAMAPKNQIIRKVEKPRIAVVYPSPEEGEKKLVLAVPGKNVRETIAMSHESLSVMRSWCLANGYTLDTSRLNRPVKPKVKFNDEDEYTY